MTAYATATQIAAYLGVTLTSPQQTQAGVVAQAASDWIDRYTGRSWQQTSPVTDERHDILGDRVYLSNRPVVSITSVKTRTYYADLGTVTLDAGQYELLDGAAGLLLVQGFARSELIALVSYTHTAVTPPSDVSLAATMIASAWLSQTLRPQTQGLDSVAVGQADIQVKFSARRDDIPAAALSILASYRTVVVA